MKEVRLMICMVIICAAAMAQQKVPAGGENQKFMLIFRFKADAPQPSPEIMKASLEQWRQWMGSLAQQGKLAGGEQIGFGGTTISGIKKEVMQKPVVANNDLVTGYMVILVKDLKEAELVAKNCPIFSFDGSVEIRPVQQQEIR